MFAIASESESDEGGVVLCIMLNMFLHKNVHKMI